jgi:hypothetical protein
MLCGGAAVVLCSAMVIAASLQDWASDRGLYRPLARTCAIVAVLCLGVGAVRPSPVLTGVALVVLLSIPPAVAVAHRLAGEAGVPPSGQSPGPGDGHLSGGTAS